METPFLLAFVVLWILVLIQGTVLIGLVTIVSRLHDDRAPARSTAPLPGLEPGTAVPAFRERDLNGIVVDSRELSGAASVLLFVSPSCSSCVTTLDEMVGLSHKARGNVVVVCQSDKVKCRQLAETYGLMRTIPDRDWKLGALFRVSVLPTAVLIDRAGRVQSYGQPTRAADLEHALHKSSPLAEASSATGG